jgi:type III pantothenate kinase
MMLVTIDIGNSNIELAKHDQTVFTYRYETDQKKSSDGYYQLLKSDLEGVTSVAISNVVPSLQKIFQTLFEKYYQMTPLWLGPGVKTGVKLPIANPKEAGADLIAAAAGVASEYGDSAIIIDMGTATTISLFKKNALLGVAITIGLDSARECLIKSTSQLLDFPFVIPDKPVGDTTLTALNAGFLYGHLYQIEGFVKALSHETTRVVITGGATQIIKSLLPKNYIYDPILIHKGLKAIHLKNKKV